MNSDFILNVSYMRMDLQTNQSIVTQSKRRNSQLTWSSSFDRINLVESYRSTALLWLETKDDVPVYIFLMWSKCYHGDNKIRSLIRKCEPFMLSCEIYVVPRTSICFENQLFSWARQHNSLMAYDGPFEFILLLW